MCKLKPDTIARWRQAMTNGFHTHSDIDEMCAMSDALTTWCDTEATKIDAEPIVFLKERILDRCHGKDVSSEVMADAFRDADQVVHRIERAAAATSHRRRSESPTAQWITVSQAKKLSDINSGVISRAVTNGEIASNKRKGLQRRINSADFNRWQLERNDRRQRRVKDEALPSES
jgi:hypothetical protein